MPFVIAATAAPAFGQVDTAGSALEPQACSSSPSPGRLDRTHPGHRDIVR